MGDGGFDCWDGRWIEERRHAFGKALRLQCERSVGWRRGVHRRHVIDTVALRRGSRRTVTLRAVLADDEPLARRKLARLLAQKFDIHLEGEASTGTEAVELIRRVKPDAAFLDIHMPGMDGFQVVEALGTLQVQVVFVT